LGIARGLNGVNQPRRFEASAGFTCWTKPLRGRKNMNPTETKRFNELYQHHLRMLKLQGKSLKTIDAYARAVRRISAYFDCCPDQLTLEQREHYFSDLVASHSWRTVKVDRNGLT
jgi:hypothetical protein